MTPSPGSLPSRTTLLLEDTSSYFDQHKCEQHELIAANRGCLAPTTPATPASTDSRPRRGFGLAPWHRRTSQESLLSVSSSVHRLLMGKAPAATPAATSEKYVDRTGETYDRGKKMPDLVRICDRCFLVEISETGQPTFLPSVSYFLQLNFSPDLEH